MPSSPGHSAAIRCSASRSNSPSARCAIAIVGGPSLAHQPGQRPRIDPGNPDPARFAAIHSAKPLPDAVIARRRHHLAHDGAQRMRLARLDVLVIGADIADVREGEGDDLLGVGGIGHHLLVSGHGGVEAQFADRFAFRAEALAPDHAPVGEHHDSRRALGLGRGQGAWIGHGGKSLRGSEFQRCR